MKSLKVIPPGAAVRVVRPEDDGHLPGVVTAVSVLAGGAVAYQVVWWEDADRREEWLEAFEVEADGEDLKLEFK